MTEETPKPVPPATVPLEFWLYAKGLAWRVALPRKGTLPEAVIRLAAELHESGRDDLLRKHGFRIESWTDPVVEGAAPP